MIYSQIPANPLHSNICSITALAFDPVSDTLWGGNSAGSLVAYHSQQPFRGVYFPVGDNRPVKKIFPGESHVRAMTESGLGLGAWTKGGCNKWYYRWDAFVVLVGHVCSSSLKIFNPYIYICFSS